jgi:hypothetical protein
MSAWRSHSVNLGFNFTTGGRRFVVSQRWRPRQMRLIEPMFFGEVAQIEGQHPETDFDWDFFISADNFEATLRELLS